MQTKGKKRSLERQKQLKRKGRERQAVQRAPPCHTVAVPYPHPQLLCLPCLGPTEKEQAFVLQPNPTAQLFIAMKYWGFPEQIVNKQSRLLLSGGGEGSLAGVSCHEVASLKCFVLAC